MENTQAYTISIGGFVLMALLIHLLLRSADVMNRMWLFLVKWLFYSNLIDRHKFLGPWPIGTVLAQVVYITVNIFCMVFRVSSISEAGLRAGRFTLINMIMLFVPYFSFATDLFGTSLHAYKCVHRSSGIMTFTLPFFICSSLYSIVNLCFWAAEGDYSRSL